MLDVWRGTIRLSKLKLQTRARHVLVLVRLDIHGTPHTNPDFTQVGANHLHVYREGFEAKWAYPLDPAVFRDANNIQYSFEDFCQYCSISGIPPVQVNML